jgi:hypothetical protein
VSPISVVRILKAISVQITVESSEIAHLS